MKTQNKIILLLISILFGIVIIFSITMYAILSNYSYTDFYKRLEIRSYSTARSELDKQNSGELIKEFKGEYLEPLSEEQHYIIQISTNKTLNTIAKENSIPLKLLKNISKNESGTYQDNNTFYCGIIYHGEDGNTYYVITSAHNYYYENHMVYLRYSIFISTVIIGIIIILISYWFSNKLINPIKKITRKIAGVGTDNLNIRLDKNVRDDEMGKLINTFNNMLDRLETSFETQNNFISNASHELNTPLTTIMGEADLALSRDRSTDEYKESLNKILLEADKLNKKTKALLFLAQTAFNSKELVFKKVRVDQLIFDVHDTINRIYPDNKIHIDFSLLPDNPEKLKIKGNEQLLHLALSNVIINAYKYSRNQIVSVSIGLSDEYVLVYIKDLGIGIPEKEIKHIYDPFFRASNTSNFEGYGIGLPLTRNIIKIHSGLLNIYSKENEGTVVEIKLPLGNYTI